MGSNQGIQAFLVLDCFPSFLTSSTSLLIWVITGGVIATSFLLCRGLGGCFPPEAGFVSLAEVDPEDFLFPGQFLDEPLRCPLDFLALARVGW